MEQPMTKRSYAEEEKRQLIANLDIEVAHRTRQFETWLADMLENFTIHQEGQISRIPKQVRAMTMREFGQKYQGNVQAALRGYQKERLVAAGADAEFGEIEKSVRKRKWFEGVEAELEKHGMKDTETPRALKTARFRSPSPKKTVGSSTGPGTAQRARLASATNKVPPSSSKLRSTSRLPVSPSPAKTRPPFNSYATFKPGSSSRPASPVKFNPVKSTTQLTATPQTHRVPSSSTFNPTLPPKTPKFPGSHRARRAGDGDEPMKLRLPRKDESMLSLNGSPLANPYQLGLGWFKDVELADEVDGVTAGNDAKLDKPPPKRNKSSITVRRDPSVAYPADLNDHSRTNSEANFHTTSSSRAVFTTHSRDPPHSTSQNKSLYPSKRLPSTHPYYVPPEKPQTPRPLAKHTQSFTALVAIPTKDGHLLEFDPLEASPGAIDALEGISDSAKKQAKLEMGKLVQAAVDKWKIG